MMIGVDRTFLTTRPESPGVLCVSLVQQFLYWETKTSQHTFAADGSEKVYSMKGSPFLLYYRFANSQLSAELLHVKVIEMV